jgi:hypothetical protein
MGLMDKVKVQYEQALTKAQQGVNQGKAKIDQAQAKHQWDALLRNLGAAVWAEQREGGSSDAVTAALAALDAHVALHSGPDEDDAVDSTEATPADVTDGEPGAPAEASGYGSVSETATAPEAVDTGTTTSTGPTTSTGTTEGTSPGA